MTIVFEVKLLNECTKQTFSIKFLYLFHLKLSKIPRKLKKYIYCYLTKGNVH